MTSSEISNLVIRAAEENSGWGYCRIQSALSNLGPQLARTTIANILKRHGIEPSPERNRKTTWKDFLRRHWTQIIATLHDRGMDVYRSETVYRSFLRPVDTTC
jgi:hypothetical protein